MNFNGILFTTISDDNGQTGAGNGDGFRDDETRMISGDDAHDAIGRHHDCIGTEAAVPTRHTASDMGGGVRHEADQQREDENPVVVEER